MAVDAGRFREIFGSFPTAVAIVTALDEAGEPKGFTCNAVSAVSVDPALLLVCVDKGSRSLPALRHSGAFVVHFLGEDGQQASDRFAGRGDDKFAGQDWYPSAAAGGAPVLTGVALAHAECVVVQQVEAGDHWILIARVEEGEVHPSRPLLYHRRGYHVWDAVPELAY
ncbi:flavin reductase family protein, partial [Kitasatospora sp. NPDC058965]|uniref:flavin reductase family protein n=1 Tax=Kitasatospora sp. NPDC058965 TaxID=3346682 RepID=UPI00368909FC